MQIKKLKAADSQDNCIPPHHISPNQKEEFKPFQSFQVGN